MEKKFFLEENRSEFSNNVEGSINVNLSTKARLLPNEDLADKFSLFKQYNAERDDCEKIRVIATVNTVSSNILFNGKSEIVINEGSSACTSVYDGFNNSGSVAKATYAPKAGNSAAEISYHHAMDDTEYSHKEIGNFVYHCGADIFNNHMLRNDGFVHVNPAIDDENKKVFNTLRDYQRDANGKIIKEAITLNMTDGIGYYPKPLESKMHLYMYDKILSPKEAFLNKCKEKDGWWGFTNPGNIEIKNFSGVNSTIMINRMLANNKACEFIDLYPDRTLFSYVPKYNKSRKRLEKNWDYCLTYPYKNDYNLFNTICGGKNQCMRANVTETVNSSSVPFLKCQSFFKHNLVAGDCISVYYYTSDNDFQLYKSGIRVQSVGDAVNENRERTFSIRIGDISEIYDDIMARGFFFKKMNMGEECSYYFRKFKKIRFDERELKSDVNKIAFGENIYGDPMAQVVFTDDIDLGGLVDNNGRPVSEIYLTSIKRNAGHELWYDKDPVYNSEEIEFSHCFGKVTSGVDFGGIDNEPFDYNVHRLHNLSMDVAQSEMELNTFAQWGDAIQRKPLTIEDDITIDEDEFYGDVVEFDNSTYTETVIGNVYHRFNTAQRECFSGVYANIYSDEIVSDDYDENGFSAVTYCINVRDSEKVLSDESASARMCYGNIFPEGYYYNPHSRIKVREESDDYKQSRAKYINYANFDLRYTSDGVKIRIEMPVRYNIIKSDSVAFYNKETKTVSWGEVVETSGNFITVFFEKDSDGPKMASDIDPNSLSRKYYAFWTPDSVPTYAKFSLSGTKFVWRPLVPPSEIIRGEDLYDLPFANGRFYVQQNVNLFVRRQDPQGTYGLSVPIYKKCVPSSNNMASYVIRGEEPVDFSQALHYIDKISNNCY